MVESNDIWSFFCKNEDFLADNLMLVAENISENTEIYLTSDCGFPRFTVEIGDKIDTTEFAWDQDSTEEIYENLLRIYIEEDDDSMYSDEESERRTELTCSMYDLLMVMCEEAPEKFNITDEKIEDLLLDFEKKVFEECGVQTKHPLITEGDGSEFFVIQYPCMDLLTDDEESSEEQAEFVGATEITGTIGKWFDSGFDTEISDKAITSLKEVYQIVVSESCEQEEPKYEECKENYNEQSYIPFDIDEEDFCV